MYYSKKLSKSKVFFLISMSIPAFIFCSIVFSSLLYGSIYVYSLVAPPPSLSVSNNTMIFGANGEKIGEYQFGVKRYFVPLKEISPYVIKATIATEDKGFYHHHGFDTKRIIGAVLVNTKSLSKSQGASTITQQLARNLYLTHEKTWKRKILEAFYTIRLEAAYTKDELLEGYLNTIYYGSGAYGIEAASKTYFQKSANTLLVEEAALLVGVPKAPTYYSPFSHYLHAIERQKLILRLMEEQKVLSSEEAATAVAAAVPLSLDVLEETTKPSYFQDAMLESLQNDLQIPKYLIEKGGLSIYTTLNPDIQKIAEKAYQEIIPDESDLQTALVVQDPKTGGILALVGGIDYKESVFNRATQARRQPGSTFKPFLYYAALLQGFTPSSLLKSEYTIFTLNDAVTTYAPKNFANKYSNELMTMQQALALSDNIYAVKTNQYIGSKHLINTVKKLGITSPLDDVPSLALGVSPVTPIEMVTAYSHFANGGKKVKANFIKKIVTADGQVVYERQKSDKQVLNPNAAFVLKKMMTGMFDSRLNGEHAIVTGSALKERMSRNYSAKSGSTSVDSWMIGFTPELVAGVWVGYDKGKLLTLYKEQSYAKEIWLQIMEESNKIIPKRKETIPANVVAVNVDVASGLLANKGCPITRKVYFVKGTEPTEYCEAHEGKNPIEKEKKKNWFKRIFE